jgi:hypothetical protein
MEPSSVGRQSDPLGNVLNSHRLFGIAEQSDNVGTSTVVLGTSGRTIKDRVVNSYRQIFLLVSSTWLILYEVRKYQENRPRGETQKAVELTRS